jgi:DNA repair protein SbcD/Mre11
MRFLHTADWHLNDRLGRIDRTADLKRSVEHIAELCKSEKVDVLVVAGDLFSELARPDALRESIHHWQSVFEEFLKSGGTILTITGNHDNENFCQTLCSAMTLAAPTVGELGDVLPAGRLYLAADPTFLRIRDRKDRYSVQCVMMPYPTATHYLNGELGQKYTSPDEKNRRLVHAFEQTLSDLRSHSKFDPRDRSVMIGHVNVYGCDVGPALFRLSMNEDVIVANTQILEQFDYVALGHIHKPQFLKVPHIRYSGSVEKLDLGERNDEKGVVIFDLGPDGLSRDISILPLASTKIYDLEIIDPTEDLPRLKQEYAHAKTDLVNLHVRYTAGKHNLEAILHELQQIFPRWYTRDWSETGALAPAILAGDAEPTESFEETVREYISQELQNHPPELRDGLLVAVEELMQSD